METTESRKSSNPPTHTLASSSSHPKRTVRTPTRENEPRYTFGSYSTRKRFTEKAELAHVGALDDPRHIQTMA